MIDYTELNEQIKVEDPLEKENIEIEKELHSANVQSLYFWLVNKAIR